MPWETLFLRDIDWDSLEQTQRAAWESVRGGGPPRLLVAEPRPTYTFGRSSKPGDLLWKESELQRRGITVRSASRGGKWTYHGPGQCVVYPIVPLEDFGYPARGVRKFVDDLRRAVMSYLLDCGLAPEPREKPYGVYVGGAKIASFGLSFERGISSNGVALYYAAQTEAFAGIHPCGCPGESFTSLREQGVDQSWDRAAYGLAESVKRVFNEQKSWYAQRQILTVTSILSGAIHE